MLNKILNILHKAAPWLLVWLVFASTAFFFLSVPIQDTIHSAINAIVAVFILFLMDKHPSWNQ